MIKDAMIYFVSKFIPALLSFIILALYLKFMKPEDYGIFSVIIVTVGLVGIMSSQWIRSSMTRFYYDYKNSINTIFTLQLLMMMLLTILSLIAYFIFDVDGYTYLIALVMLYALLINELLNNYYRTLIQPIKVLYGTIIKNIIYLLALMTVIFTKLELSYEIGLLAYTLGLIISNAFYFIGFKFKKYNLHIDLKLLKTFISYGGPLTISFALGVLLQNIDKYMITGVLGTKHNGNYSIVYDFVHNYLYMIMGSLGMASLPRILKDNADRLESFEKYTLILKHLTIPIVILLLVLSKELAIIINVFNYHTTYLILIFIIIGTYFHGANSFIYGQAFQLMESTKNILFASFVAIVINTAINLMFLEEFGVIISAISTLIAFYISNLLLKYRLRKSMNFTFVSKVSGIYALYLILIPLIFYVNEILWLSIVIKITAIMIVSFIVAVFLKKRGM
ncbi:oligosaccharide flippase family protein [Staphylococcus delphini]|uniref:oligosaccharide flippase family protein n=1 Tax=Staphylococcus delphini TaxID=53344 RepID=UPI001CCF3B1C|nr:oligosaccharide flippase family protein [Staphylococcus delphini]MBZ8174618.1 oligosaccharide flippase family protein [Staphylococcus delphini]